MNTTMGRTDNNMPPIGSYIFLASVSFASPAGVNYVNHCPDKPAEIRGDSVACEYRPEFVREVRSGLADLDAGKFFTDEQVRGGDQAGNA
jgi:hypothetical protein